MAKPSKEINYAYRMQLKERKRQERIKLMEEERYNSLCGPVTVTKIKAS